MREFNSVWSNTGLDYEMVFTLPRAADRSGLELRFVVENENGMRLVAPSGQRIQLGPSLSSVGGYVHSKTTGSVLTLSSIGAAPDPVWVATSMTGTWTAE